jgi:hypothetical protein
MIYRCKLPMLALLAASSLSHAGFYEPTAHSRANCAGFNESVTWDGIQSFNWRVESHHFRDISWPGPTHILNTGTVYTWRAAAYHATEAYSSRGDKWYVRGFHFYYPDGKERLDVITTAVDCSIYDGWWDRNGV